MRMKRFERWKETDDGKNILRFLDVDYSPPYFSEKGYVKDGGMFVTIGEGGQKESVKLNIGEIALLGEICNKVVESHIKQQADMYEEAYQEYKARQKTETKPKPKATLV